MELRLQGMLAGVAMAATLMLSGCGDDDTYDYYYYVPPPSQITEAIAFMAYPNDSFEIWGMKADGSKKTPLAYIVNGGAIQGVFSPDGRKLLFVKQDATGSKIIEKDLQSGALTELVTDSTSSNNPFTPSYSPDGTKIAYHDNRNGIHVMNSYGTIDLQLPDTTPADITPSWNSDGTKIVFVRGWPSNGKIWVMNPDGTDQIEVQPENTDLGITYWQPKFLPDGRIVCMRQSTSLDIVIMNADGSNPVNLTPDTNDSDEFYPSVNIAGNKIAFATDRLGHQDVYVGTLSGTTLTNLVNLTGDIDFDCWRPSFGFALLP